MTKATISGHSPANTQCRDHFAHADQLQRDVGHGRQNAGDCEGDREPAAAVAAAHVIGKGYVSVTVAYGQSGGSTSIIIG